MARGTAFLALRGIALRCIGMVFCNIVPLRTRDDVKIS
jgi:hypothetical protein